jgi:hypothetical protein
MMRKMMMMMKMMMMITMTTKTKTTTKMMIMMIFRLLGAQPPCYACVVFRLRWEAMCSWQKAIWNTWNLIWRTAILFPKSRFVMCIAFGLYVWTHIVIHGSSLSPTVYSLKSKFAFLHVWWSFYTIPIFHEVSAPVIQPLFHLPCRFHF